MDPGQSKEKFQRLPCILFGLVQRDELDICWRFSHILEWSLRKKNYSSLSFKLHRNAGIGTCIVSRSCVPTDAAKK